MRRMKLVTMMMMKAVIAADGGGGGGGCGCGFCLCVRPRLGASVTGEPPDEDGGRERNCDGRQMLLQKPL